VKVPAAGEDEKFVVYGALDYATGQLIWQTSARKGDEAFAAFLDQLATALPADVPAVVVLDNAGYHKSHTMRAYWQRLSSRLQPFWLPAYAPQLNLIERVWRFFKEKLSCHRWWRDVNALLQATQTLLAGLKVHFHATDGPSLQLVQNFPHPA
jgi:transposase